MKEMLLNIGGWILTSIAGVINIGNVVSWISYNKIFFNISGAILITIVTLIWWILKIISDNRKSKIELEIKKFELEERKITCEELRIEVEIKKQQLK